MVSETLLVPIITGGCGILSICIERTTNIVCPELRKKIINLCAKSEAQEDEEDEEDEEEPPVIPPVIHDDISNNNIIINSPATCVFDIVWESPNIGKNKSIYTSVINNGNHYNIEIPPSLNNVCVNVYKEFFKRSATKKYYLAVKLSNLTNDNVKLFIKRFRVKNFINREWVPTSFKPFEYIQGKEGINIFTTNSFIGVNDVLFEQLGVMVESNENTYSNCVIERVYLENRQMYISN